MCMDAINENVAELINFVGFEVDLIRGFLPVISLLVFKFFFKVQDLVITILYKCIVIRLQIIDNFIFVLPRSDEVFYILAENSVVLLEMGT